MPTNPIYSSRKIPQRVLNSNIFVAGIADNDKNSPEGSYAFGRSIETRLDPRAITLLPATAKESGSVYKGLPKWAERVINRVSLASSTYLYDASGNLYNRTSAGSHSLLRSVAASHGNGLKYFGEDDFLYYSTDKSIGRYGPVSGVAPTYTDDWLTSSGGVPTNTFSLATVAASSEYATAASSASLQITGDICLETWFKPSTLPAVGSSMTLAGKWDESGATRGYKFDIFAISGVFGTGADGSLTISSNTTDSPIDSAATGTSGTNNLSATNASFTSGQVILIHQTQGTGAGTWQKTSIQGYSTGTITTTDNLNATYTTGAQVLVGKQYSSVTVNSGITWTAKAWNGTTGGILFFLCEGTVTNAGNIVADSCGFRGYVQIVGGSAPGAQGEGTAGVGGTQSTSANGNGGGGAGNIGNGGAGGGNANTGAVGTGGAIGGSNSGTSDLTTSTFGGAGGSSPPHGGNNGAQGGNGGGWIFILGSTITNTGSITSNGGAGNGGASGVNPVGAGGGGAGGSILLKAQTATLGTNLITVIGGTSIADGGADNGGIGSEGRFHLDYLTSFTGSANAGMGTATYNQDNTLVTTTSYQFRIGISNDGTANEYLAKTIPITAGNWYHGAVSWNHTTSTATFFLNGVSQGTVVGTKTSISSNAALLYVAANKGVSTVGNFFDGKLDELRLWNTQRTSTQIQSNMNIQVSGSSVGLAAYYQFNNSASDVTSNANNLTLVNSPTYSTDVPFSGATTRVDIDQTGGGTANTYTLLTSLSEAASDNFTFVPANDPQKSVQLNINAKGTGDWTLVVHDGLNNQIATVTVTNANLPSSGNYEFVWTNVWRPVIGATYHIHAYSTVNDGSVKTTTTSSFATASFTTYYQFLVTDTSFHPITDMLNFIAIGNERYLATWDAATYKPMRLKFPAGTRVRCFGKWREYLAIGCIIGNSTTDYDYGRIFFWDGSSVTYNFWVDVPEGAINAMYGENDSLYISAGYKGDVLVFQGLAYNGIGSSATKLFRLPKMVKDPQHTVEIYPGAMNFWQAMLRIGVAGSSTSSVLQRGVYTFGRLTQNFPMGVSFDYPISTGDVSSNTTVGLVYPVDSKLLIGWGDNGAYGVDIVDPLNNPYFTTGTLELPIMDIGVDWKEKAAKIVRADFLPLPTGTNIDIKYKMDRASNWTNLGISNQAVGDTYVRLQVPAKDERHHEIQIAIDFYSTGTNTPTLLEAGWEEDYLLDENNY